MGEAAERKYYKQKLKQGTISLADMKNGRF